MVKFELKDININHGNVSQEKLQSFNFTFLNAKLAHKPTIITAVTQNYGIRDIRDFETFLQPRNIRFSNETRYHGMSEANSHLLPKIAHDGGIKVDCTKKRNGTDIGLLHGIIAIVIDT